jgi:hypothetical protein
MKCLLFFKLYFCPLFGNYAMLKNSISPLSKFIKLWHLTCLVILNICAPSPPSIMCIFEIFKIQLNFGQIGLCPFILSSLPLQTDQKEKEISLPAPALSLQPVHYRNTPSLCLFRLDSRRIGTRGKPFSLPKPLSLPPLR